jgi:hypothetical protein
MKNLNFKGCGMRHLSRRFIRKIGTVDIALLPSSVISQVTPMRYDESPRNIRYGDRIPVGRNFSALLQIGPGPIQPSVHLAPDLFPGP